MFGKELESRVLQIAPLVMPMPSKEILMKTVFGYLLNE
jgi:hypothetical protein